MTNNKKPILILISGGIGSGKSSLSKTISEKLQKEGKRVAILPTDEFLSDYYIKGKNKPKPTDPLKERVKWNTLHGHEPKTTNLPLLNSCLETLLKRKDTHYPIAIRKPGKPTVIGKQEVKAGEVIIIEGHRALQHEEINKVADLKIFIDIDEDLRMIRMIKRNPWYNEMIGKEIEDPRMFGENLPDCLEIWLESVKVPHKKFVEPTKKCSDLILNNDAESSLEKNVQTIVSLIDLYFQNEEEFKIKIRPTKTRERERERANMVNCRWQWCSDFGIRSLIIY